MRSRCSFVAAGVLLALLAGCWRGTSNLTTSGRGRPLLGVDFPATTEPGSVHTATLTVTNPGPGAMASVIVSFTLVGAPAEQGLPTPIVAPSAGGARPSVVRIDPDPIRISGRRTVFGFGGLEEGASSTIEFDLRAPDEPGPATNAVIVSDGVEPDRARGIRLETVVSE